MFIFKAMLSRFLLRHASDRRAGALERPYAYRTENRSNPTSRLFGAVVLHSSCLPLATWCSHTYAFCLSIINIRVGDGPKRASGHDLQRLKIISKWAESSGAPFRPSLAHAVFRAFGLPRVGNFGLREQVSAGPESSTRRLDT